MDLIEHLNGKNVEIHFVVGSSAKGTVTATDSNNGLIFLRSESFGVEFESIVNLENVIQILFT